MGEKYKFFDEFSAIFNRPDILVTKISSFFDGNQEKRNFLRFLTKMLTFSNQSLNIYHQ